MFAAYAILPIFQSLRVSLRDRDGIGEETFYTLLQTIIRWLALPMPAVPAGLFVTLSLNRTVFGFRPVNQLFFFPFAINQVVARPVMPLMRPAIAALSVLVFTLIRNDYF